MEAAEATAKIAASSAARNEARLIDRRGPGTRLEDVSLKFVLICGSVRRRLSTPKLRSRDYPKRRRDLQSWCCNF